jgi:hypothetical protein
MSRHGTSRPFQLSESIQSVMVMFNGLLFSNIGTRDQARLTAILFTTLTFSLLPRRAHLCHVPYVRHFLGASTVLILITR